MVLEAYEQRFRECRKRGDQSYVEYAHGKMFERWCSSNVLEEKCDRLRQMVLIKELKNCLPVEIKTYINEQKWGRGRSQDCDIGGRICPHAQKNITKFSVPRNAQDQHSDTKFCI